MAPAARSHVLKYQHERYLKDHTIKRDPTDGYLVREVDGHRSVSPHIYNVALILNSSSFWMALRKRILSALKKLLEGKQ